MRIIFGMTLVCCLLAAGCKTSGKNTAAGNSASATGQPWLPPAPEGTTERERAQAEAEAVPEAASGLIAGQIIDPNNRRAANATIQVVALDSSNNGAPLKVAANKNGSFYISGLKAKKRYRLVARSQDGKVVYEGKAEAVPPKGNLVIYLVESGVAAEKRDKTPEKPAPTPPPPEKPAASLQRPQPRPGLNATAPVVPNPAQIGAAKTKEPFTKVEETPAVNIPGPGQDSEGSEQRKSERYTPPPLPTNPLAESLPRSTAPSAAPLPKPPSPAPLLPTPAPKGTTKLPTSKSPEVFCQMDGTRLLNFALLDASGKRWEKNKEGKRARVILLDFWHSRCPHCDHALPKVKKLHADYARYGLQVVGVAVEEGTLEKQRGLVQLKTRTKDIRYPMLLAGDGKGGACSLVRSLDFDSYPAFVLIDQQGKILRKFSGNDAMEFYYLELAIRRQVGLPVAR